MPLSVSSCSQRRGSAVRETLFPCLPGSGGWYIENSLTTLGQKDPVSEYNTSLWNNGTDAGKDALHVSKSVS